MANVVLCSEYGRGSRYLAKLADYAVELQAQGHAVRLVCRDVHTAHQLREFERVSLFPAPSVELDSNTLSSQADERPLNYSSVLLMNGYRDVQSLVPLLRCWLHYMATLDADLVVADHSPTALLAGKLLAIPCIMTGSGYTVPPKQHPMPSVAPWRQTESSSQPDSEGDANTRDDNNADLHFEDEKLLHTLNLALQELNFNNIKLTEVRQLFEHAAQWLITLPEMDHYQARDVPYVVRWLNRNNQQDPLWPYGPGDKIFVYMDASAPHLPSLLTQLKELGDPVLAVIANVSDAFQAEYQCGTIKIQSEHVNIARVAEQSKAIINHSGHNLVYELLRMGLPSILLPSNPENMLLAYRLAEQGLAFAGPTDARHLDIAQLLKQAKQQDQVWHNAARLSMRYEKYNSLARLHDLVASKLTKVQY